MMVERSPILKLILDLFSFLQEEIMKVSVDQSIFAWSFESLDIEKDLGRISLMAPWPTNVGQRQYVAVLECTDSRLPQSTHTCLSKPERKSYRLCISLSLPIENVTPTQRLHIPRLGQPDAPDFCRSCQSSSLGSDSYIFYFFDAVNHPRPSSLPSSRQVSVSLDFEHETAGGIRNTRFVLNAQIDFNERRGFLCYGLVPDKGSFWNHMPGRRAENMRGRAEVAILGGQTSRHRNYREIPIFLSFEKADEGAIGHQTSKTVVFWRAEDAGGFRQSQGESARRGLDLHSERP
ncbi:hypothetical protein CHU98_g12458 [Xylaria longipes]|nr:hypothetical protein CHU98_g12458 [Xylaria longipes]